MNIFWRWHREKEKETRNKGREILSRITRDRTMDLGGPEI